MTPSLIRRMSQMATVQQPAFAGGAAGAILSISCVPPVRISARTSEKFKMATTFRQFETFTAMNDGIKTGMVLTVDDQEYVIKFTGEYNYGRSPVMQLVLELSQ